MIKLSRRQLAKYAAEQLLNNRGTSKLARELAAVLVTSKRQNQAGLLASDIAWELENRGKLAQAQVTSATKLSEATRKKVSQFVKKNAKVEQVALDEQIDETILGGVRIETASHRWDQTLARQLSDIKEAVRG